MRTANIAANILLAGPRGSCGGEQHLELPVEELLKRARPLPPHEEMIIEGLTEEEGQAFFDAVNS